MAKSVARLSVSLRANTKQFSRGMKNAQKTLRKFGRSVTDVAVRTAKLAVVLGGAATAAIVLFTKHAFTSIDVLAKTADKLGVNIGQLQAYRLAAKQAGVEQRSFDTGIQRLLRRFGEFEVGSGEAKAALKELGVEAKSFSKLDLDGKIRKLADSFGKIASPTQKLRLAFKLFDTEGVALVNLLNIGSAGLDKMMARIQQLGGVMTRVQARMVENANNALAQTSFAFRRIFENFAVAISPMIETLANALIDVNAGIDTTVQGFQVLITSAFNGFGRLIDKVRQLGIEVRLMGVAIKQEIVRAIDFVRNNQSLLQGLFFGFTGKLIPGNETAGLFSKALKEDIAAAFKEIDRLQQALDATPTSLKFLRSIENVFKRAKEAAGGGISALGQFADMLNGPSAGGGGGRRQQFRQVSVSRFGLPPGASKSKPQIVSDPFAARILANILRQQLVTAAAGGLL